MDRSVNGHHEKWVCVSILPATYFFPVVPILIVGHNIFFDVTFAVQGMDVHPEPEESPAERTSQSFIFTAISLQVCTGIGMYSK